MAWHDLVLVGVDPQWPDQVHPDREPGWKEGAVFVFLPTRSPVPTLRGWVKAPRIAPLFDLKPDQGFLIPLPKPGARGSVGRFVRLGDPAQGLRISHESISLLKRIPDLSARLIAFPDPQGKLVDALACWVGSRFVGLATLDRVA